MKTIVLIGASSAMAHATANHSLHLISREKGSHPTAQHHDATLYQFPSVNA